MSFADSARLMAQLADLRMNRDNADVTLNCQGEVIKAHSFVLAIRYVCLMRVTIHPNSGIFLWEIGKLS